MTEAQKRTLGLIGSLRWKNHGRTFDAFAIDTDTNSIEYEVVALEKPLKRLGRIVIWADGYVERWDKANHTIKRKIESINRNLRKIT